MAAIAALSALKNRCQVDLYSDSQYVVNAMNKSWVRRWQARNWMRNKDERSQKPDLWEKLLELCARHQVSFHWIKGHNNHLENDRCDQLAVAAASAEHYSRMLGMNPKYLYLSFATMICLVRDDIIH